MSSLGIFIATEKDFDKTTNINATMQQRIVAVHISVGDATIKNHQGGVLSQL